MPIDIRTLDATKYKSISDTKTLINAVACFALMMMGKKNVPLKEDTLKFRHHDTK